ALGRPVFLPVGVLALAVLAWTAGELVGTGRVYFPEDPRPAERLWGFDVGVLAALGLVGAGLLLAGLALMPAEVEASTPEEDAVEDDAPPASDAAADVERTLAWYRAALEERVPEEGDFEPVRAALHPVTRRLAGLVLHLEVHGWHSRANPGDDLLRVLEIRVASAGGSELRTSVEFGTRADLIRELEAGSRTDRVTRLLEKAGRELWRGDGRSLDERLEEIRAGRHAALPSGPDCERFNPKLTAYDIGPREELFDDERLAIALVRCRHCGQTFVHQFVEVWDDRWNFWARVSDEEAALVRQDYGWATALLLSRRRLTRPPGGGAHWDEGSEMVLRMGPRW
ncbi:MAG: hypothetical protein AB1941_16970, partial [Gemmatimonadota bacterium]